MKEELDIKIENGKNYSILNLKGNLTLLVEDKILDTYNKIKEKNILFNFENVKYINSGGIAILIDIVTRAQETNKKIFGCNLIEHFQKVFHIVSLDKYIKFVDDKEAFLNQIK
jgi:anti-anti-sigma factor